MHTCQSQALFLFFLDRSVTSMIQPVELRCFNLSPETLSSSPNALEAVTSPLSLSLPLSPPLLPSLASIRRQLPNGLPSTSDYDDISARWVLSLLVPTVYSGVVRELEALVKPMPLLSLPLPYPPAPILGQDHLMAYCPHPSEVSPLSHYQSPLLDHKALAFLSLPLVSSLNIQCRLGYWCSP